MDPTHLILNDSINNYVIALRPLLTLDAFAVEKQLIIENMLK